MATISKFYLHDAATTNTGTMPGAGNAFQIQRAGGGADDTGDATGARTARKANDVIGTLQTSSTITANANTLAQHWGHRRFVSAPLAAHTFAAADGNWTFSYAVAESNANHNGQTLCIVSFWRPSTGSVVGSNSVYPNMLSASTGLTEFATSSTGTSGSLSILDGDILVIEVSDIFAQSMSTAYTDTFFYDGTTEASITSCASFVTPPAALTLFGGGITYVTAGHAVESA